MKKKICLRSCNELKETFQRRNKEAFLENNSNFFQGDKKQQMKPLKSQEIYF